MTGNWIFFLPVDPVLVVGERLKSWIRDCFRTIQVRVGVMHALVQDWQLRMPTARMMRTWKTLQMVKSVVHVKGEDSIPKHWLFSFTELPLMK